MMEEEKYVAEAMKAGALGYILKTTDQAELIHAIQIVARGEQYISTQIAMNILNNLHLPQPNPVSAAAQEAASKLTKRELEVLKFIAQGYTNQQIADITFTSKHTIETHRQSMLEKPAVKTLPV